MSSLTEHLTLSAIIPANIPAGSVADLPAELKAEIPAFLERGRAELRLNNLVYAAAHTLLRGVPVHRVEASLEEWGALQKLLPELAPKEVQTEIGLFYRNTKMLARLGDIATDMTIAALHQSDVPTKEDKPILLFASGKTHTPRLGQRLNAVGVSFSSNVPSL
jgi:hypothetical protein